MIRFLFGWLKYLAILIPGLPILYFEWDEVESYLGESIPSLGWLASDEDTPSESAPASAVSPGENTASAKSRIDTPSNVPMEQAFDFSITAPWVLGRWPRVTTRLSQLDLQGFRVPLVTGTKIDDLSGSLAYYFDQRDQLQRITFYGVTGDARRLAALLSNRFGLRRFETTDPQVYLYQALWNGEPRAQLWIQPRAVIDIDKPYERFEVTIAIDRPSQFSRFARATQPKARIGSAP